VAHRIESLVAIDTPTERPAWMPAFRERIDALLEEGQTKGINFSLLIAIELSRRMVSTADNEEERWVAAILLGVALGRLGERESGPARLQEAVQAYQGALLERTRDRVPLDWAMSQSNLGLVLQRLGERESGTARLEEAVEAYQAALLERTRDRVPLQWATTQ